jgi:uncharacterized lipoprotein YddW (UPF0748 family)
MRRRTSIVPFALGLVLLLTLSASAQESSAPAVCFYRDGQAAAAPRPVILSGDPEEDAVTLLSALLAGPMPEEQAEGLTSALPPGTRLVAVMVVGEEVTVDLRLPPGFLRDELDAGRSDAIVEQVVKTLYPLSLHQVHVRAEDEAGELLALSSFLPRPLVPLPAIPANEEPLPDRPGRAPDYTGQPPAFGQGQPQGALSGKAVWLSAGHGWYCGGDPPCTWRTQRPNTHGIVEDLADAEAVNYYLARYLWNAGADVWLVRERAMTEEEVIVDDDDGAPGYTETGSWATTTYTGSGYNGGDYRYTTSAGSLSATATWTPNLPEAGWYAVRAWYRHGGNRTTDARYEIHHAGGVTEVSISQEVHGQTWRYLGEYYFEAGTAGHVTLLNQSDDPGQAVIADAMRFGGGLGSIATSGGTSGRPRWEEAAKYWAQYQGAPSGVYDSDVTARPLYAEWESAKGYAGEAENAVYISWHTNAFNGTLTGTESYIHDTRLPTGSVRLQDWVHGELIHDLRGGWEPEWVDRGQKTADFGEVRELSAIPGVLLEVAFHDSEDANDLREPVFRQIAARAVFQGIVKYQAEREGTAVRLAPEPPTHLVARNSGPGQVTLTWTPPSCCDGVLGDAATAYKVYHSANGRAFDNGSATASPTLTLSNLPAGGLHFLRVTALNEGGESFPTAVVAVRTPAKGGSPAFLVVDGFDRLDQTAMIPQWESPVLGTAQRMFLERMNRYDYAVEHGRALSACGLAFDGAVNEAVMAGDVALAPYPAVDWFVGEDSVADAALDDTERALLASYLDGGGRLLISGAEIGYDLVEKGRDPVFFEHYLRASYGGDNADTYDFAGVAGGPFEGLAGHLDNSTEGTYDVGYPDRLAAAPGSDVVATYVGGTADGAAVAYDESYRLVHFGFPLETVTDPATRNDLFCATADYLLPSLPTSCVPRLINPGFEGGVGQPAWQVSAPTGMTIVTHRDNLPAYVDPHEGDWLAWLRPEGSYTPGVSDTVAITQTVALPAGEPTATLSLAWFVHAEDTPANVTDTMSVGIYDLTGTLQTRLLTVTNHSAAGAWQSSQFDVGAFSGETVRIALRAGTSATAFFVDDVSLSTCGPQGDDEFRALWVDAWHNGIKTRQQVDELIETAQAGSFNALVVQVRRRGDTYYPSDIDPWAADADQTFDALAYLIARAHAAGIEVHAWDTTLAIWNGTTPPASPDHTFNLHGPEAEGRDRWLMYSYSGEGSEGDAYYVDPGHPDVVDYTVDVYVELATEYDLDGVHLDWIRYPWQDWGYNPTSVTRFQAHTGRDDMPDPGDEEWLQWRRDQLAGLMRKIYLSVTAVEPELRVSASLSAAGGAPREDIAWETRTPYTHHLQDWPSWLEEGTLDLGLPMNYRDEDESNYALDFDRWIAWEKDHQYGRGAVVGTGLYKNDVADSMAQWLRVRQPSDVGNRVLGMSGFSYATPSDAGTPRRDFVNAAVTEVFTQSAQTPAVPWKDAPMLGHLMGTLTQAPACLNLDETPLTLTGPETRILRTDGSGWFGAVDLAPGEYVLSVDVLTPPVTIDQPVSVTAGNVTEQEVLLPTCPSWKVYIPLVLKGVSP